MIFEQHLFINDMYFGKMQRGLVAVHETVQPPSSYAFFCPSCATVWCRAVIDNRPFSAWHRACGQHPSPFLSERPGSIWMEWDRDFTNALPDAALRRELEIHLLQAEKGLLE